MSVEQDLNEVRSIVYETVFTGGNGTVTVKGNFVKDEGKKDDAGKPQWHLFPWRAAQKVVEVLMHGALKYGEFNWKKLDDIENRYLDAALRHMVEYALGKRIDVDSGKPVLAHAVCCLMFLLELEEEGVDHE